MRKHYYRATTLQRLDVDRLQNKVIERDCVLGIDVAKEDFAAVLMDGRRQVLEAIKWQHPGETPTLVDLFTERLHFATLEVAMEPSGTYGDALRALLLGRGIPVYRVSPKRTHDAAEVYDGVPSMHDVKASTIIARLHLDGAGEYWPLPDEAHRTWMAKTKILALADDQLHRNVNRLEGLMSRHWPELCGYLELGRATVLELLGQFGSAQRIVAHEAEARALMRRIGRFNLTGDKIDQVLASAHRTIGLPCVEAERVRIQFVALECRRMQKAVTRLGHEVEAFCKEDSRMGAMAAAVGKRTAAVLFAELGPPDRYDNAGSYMKSMGLNLKERSSGKKKGRLCITKRGSGIVRRYLFMAALRLIGNDPVVRRWYQAKIRRDGDIRMKAVVAVMRKLARALWHVSQGERFDSSRLFNMPVGASA